MRYIDISQLQLDADWQTKADEKLQELKDALSDLPTFDLVKKRLFNGGHWRDGRVKPVLSALSDGNCWYCESSLARQHGDVDHFRPKGAVEEDEHHPGYWWLTFNPTNFRLSCVICNQASTQDGARAGKRDRFPLLDGSPRASLPTDDYRLERPVFLDPTNADDTALIFFELDGLPRPSFREEVDPIKYLRAQRSIETFALDQDKTCMDRRKSLQALNTALKSSETIEQTLDRLPHSDRARFQDRLHDLRTLIQNHLEAGTEYLSALVSLAKTFHGQSVWLDGLLRAKGYLN